MTPGSGPFGDLPAPVGGVRTMLWTPRRIVFSLLGLVVASACYFGYAQVLGSYDGLPPLPASYQQRPTGEIEVRPAPSPGNSTEQQIVKAFGENCAELHYPLKFWMRHNRMLICFQEFKILKDGPRAGWVELSPLSLATFGERPGPSGLEEIDSVYCDRAYVRFDQPVRAMGDFNGRKLAAAELHADPEAMIADPRKGRIRLVNNRRTADPNDDVELVTPGPVYYEADPRPGQPNIFTLTAVQIFDYLNTNQPKPDRSLPREPTMAGVGLQVFLSRKPKDETLPKSADPLANAKEDRRQPVTGVDVVGLDRSVEMNLWSDSNSSFVAPVRKAPPKKKDLDAKKDSTPPEKRLIQIRTEGPFRYDLARELAHFEKPANRNGLVEHVTVSRSDKSGGHDLLVCEYMDVQFYRRKPAPDAKDKPKPKGPIAKRKPAAGGEGDLEVKSIRAWGETVVMTSDSENLNATGSELIHDAEERLTILKGSPSQQVVAVKEGNLIRGSEMHLYADDKQVTQAHISGAGSIGFGEYDPKTKKYEKQASWTNRMVYMRVQEKGQPMDVLTFLSNEGTRANSKSRRPARSSNSKDNSSKYG